MNTTQEKDQRGYLEFNFIALDAEFVRPIDTPVEHFPNLSGFICPDARVAMWSGKDTPPAIGNRVSVQFWNTWQPAKVLGYFREDGWLGITVALESAPKEYLKRNKRLPEKAHAFGLEVRPITNA